MKIALLGNSSSIHCVRWANGLVQRGHSVVMVSAHRGAIGFDSRVELRILPYAAPAGYLLNVHYLRKLLRRIKPNLLNAHYATGYGTLARVTGYKPLALSVWGADVYDFPKRSALHHWLVRTNIEAATVVCSTSRCMAEETRPFSKGTPLFVTPFGVDTVRFSPAAKPSHLNGEVVIGTVKTLANKYGVDTLIMAFAEVYKRLGFPAWLRLEIAGDGPEGSVLRELCEELNIAKVVTFHGHVEHEAVPDLINRLDIFVALSRLDSESFGVAAIEASACSKPIVVSDVSGFSEVTVDGKSGFIVPRENHLAAAEAILKLISDRHLCHRMGQFGREYVSELYSWERSLDIMIDVYEQAVKL